MSDKNKIVLTPAEQTMFDKYTATVQRGDQLCVYLQVGVQGFRLDIEPDDSQQATWFRQMLAKALARIAEESALDAFQKTQRP